MRDVGRDQQSAERFAFVRDDQILVEQARTTNAELLGVLNEWTETWDELLAARIADLVRDLQAIRYELVRRNVPHPNGAQVNVVQTARDYIENQTNE